MQDTTTFLLVEDELNDVLLMEMQFKRARANIAFRAVSDGGEAMQYLEGKGDYADRQSYPIPDVILLDLKMPRVNGFEFLAWLRSKGPEGCRVIPVVIMSSSALKKDVERAYKLGANAYMIKPVDWNLFRERITALGIYWADHVETPVP